MSDEVREEDDWLYGESADGLLKDEAHAHSDSFAHGERKDADEGGDSMTKATSDDEGQDNIESTDEGTQEEGRSRKRNNETIESEEISGDEKGEGDESEADEDDESDDDGVMVTIGDIKATTPGFSGKRSGAPPPDKKGKFSVEDFDGPGQINGVPAQDFNLDALEEKPWRKPGADITDFFNYGFTEETWRAYCDKQKRLRYESGHQAHQMAGSGESKYIGVTGQQQLVFPKKFVAQGQRKDGQMNIMGIPMGMGMRRDNPSENTIQVMTADRREYSRKQFEMGLAPMMPPPFDMTVPPPPFPPRGGEFMGPPPDFFNHPPPADYYSEEGPEYEEQQWMDSQWEMEGEGGSRMGVGPSALVVPLTKVTEVPPPPGETLEDAPETDGVKVEPS